MGSIRVLSRFFLAGAMMLLLNVAGAYHAGTAPTNPGLPGLLAGVTTWEAPTAPNGFVSKESWFSISNSPKGEVYVATSDHITNSAFFTIDKRHDTMVYAGDAQSASEAANNWLPGETVEKFHMRPLYYKGRAYVATADYSNQDAGYVAAVRGFKMYAWDTKTHDFIDLSANRPGGVEVEDLSIFSGALDEKRGVIYMLASPNSNLYRYDIKTGVTTDLGRSPELSPLRPMYNPGRALWIDTRGRVHFSVATAGTLAPGEPLTPTYVLWWDPVVGWGSNPTWQISEMLRVYQCTPDKKKCYVMTYPLDLYEFDDENYTWTKMGKGVLPPEYISSRTRNFRVRSMNLSPNGKKIYFLNDSAPKNGLWEWEYPFNTAPRLLSDIQNVDARYDVRYTAFTGHDAWDLQGRFFFAGFGGEGVPATPNVYTTRIDPVRLKANLGMLPGVPELKLVGGGEHHFILRFGDQSTALKALVAVEDKHTGQTTYHEVNVPANRLISPVPSFGKKKDLTLLADGDTYVLKDSH